MDWNPRLSLQKTLEIINRMHFKGWYPHSRLGKELPKSLEKAVEE
jgi:hypothetical protein